MNASSHSTAENSGLLDFAAVLARYRRLLILAPLAAGSLALGATYLMDPIYTAKVSFLPPQQQQSSSMSALASLGALSGLAGGLSGMKSPGDQYIGLMQSVNVQDRIVDKFKLMDVFKSEFRFQARRSLEANVRFALGKKDTMIAIEVDDKDPQRAADIANQYIVELRRLTNELALTEAQQRRVFFEAELKRTRDRLTQAQLALQGSGFNPSAIKAEPKTAAEEYARLRAETTAAEVSLQAMRRTLVDSASEIQRQNATIAALRAELRRIESADNTVGLSDYVSRYREYKYQESLFELFSKQYEMARLDEARDGGLLQVIDVATKPEYKSRPKRAMAALLTWFVTGMLILTGLMVVHLLTTIRQDPANRSKLDRIRLAWKGD
ncbi:Wzz/FepE/Etk N-terminal domain-containing protein [Roseateles sp. BYS78W]|uniref:Wzz/FepE/Etk N-terminal domain-containing protein n=1 Tax=Pelomonas candidula TaxID=3299025 RepID=A0ABW7HA62_9BURK